MIDNVTDIFMPDQGRPAGGRPARARACRPPFMEGGLAPNALLAEHGFSVLVTVAKNDSGTRSCTTPAPAPTAWWRTCAASTSTPRRSRLQDRESGVFLAATSNNITVLPPEMIRKGRFDEIFFVDLPSVEVRAALFELHLKKRGRDATTFDLQKLAAGSDGFSGAEIEQVIVAGLYTAFAQKQQLTTEVLLLEMHSTQPLSVTRAEEVASIRESAKTRAAPAD